MIYLSFDVESCTGNPLDGSLCSFGYVLAEDGKIIEQGDILCNPLPKTFTLGGFSKEPRIKLAYPIKHFRMQPRFNSRYCEIKGLFERADVILGFAVHNDIKYVNNACDSFMLERMVFRFLDVQIIMGLLLPEYKNHGLKAIAERYGLQFEEHRSDEDARVTYLVLEKLLEETGKTLFSVIDEFNIIPGKNGQEGHVNCYSKTEAWQRATSNSKSSRKILLNYYGDRASDRVKKKGDKLKGKAVAISETLTGEDILLARSVAVTVAVEGGEYESSLTRCSLFVCTEGDRLVQRMKKINPECQVLTVKQFSDMCGGLTDYPFDDKKIMEEHYSQLVSDR